MYQQYICYSYTCRKEREYSHTCINNISVTVIPAGKKESTVIHVSTIYLLQLYLQERKRVQSYMYQQYICYSYTCRKEREYSHTCINNISVTVIPAGKKGSTVIHVSTIYLLQLYL